MMAKLHYHTWVLAHGLPDIEINIVGVTKLLKEINPYKATGPDCIPAKVLKEMAEELSPSLALIFSASLQQGKIPQDWRKALTTPLLRRVIKQTLQITNQSP